MIDQEQKLKLQAFFDGELSEREAREVANWLARDSEAAQLHAEMKNTRQALAGFEAGIKLPESREFFWSKIERDILRAEAAQAKVSDEVATFSFLALLRRSLMPAAALAALVVALIVVIDRSPAMADLETTTADGGALTYRNYESGTTLVWLTYPAENGLADNPGVGTIQRQ
jgi:anti-sigma factor RsiW